MPQISVRIPQDDLDELDETIENDHKLEGRSQAIRAAVRLLNSMEKEGEFEQAR